MTQTSCEVYSSYLPLAIYQELVAHLGQVAGIQVDLLPQQASQFDYSLSQMGGLRIHFTTEADQASRQRVQQILAYYGDRYGELKLK